MKRVKWIIALMMLIVSFSGCELLATEADASDGREIVVSKPQIGHTWKRYGKTPFSRTLRTGFMQITNGRLICDS